MAFERLEQGRLFAADIRARSAKNDDAHVDRGSQTALTDDARCLGLPDGSLQPIGRADVLPADVDEGRLGADCVTAQCDALEHAVWLDLHQLAVFERARL